MSFGVRLTVLVEFLIPLARNNKLLNVTAVGFSSWSERETDQWLRIERETVSCAKTLEKENISMYIHAYIHIAFQDVRGSVVSFCFHSLALWPLLRNLNLLFLLECMFQSLSF